MSPAALPSLPRTADPSALSTDLQAMLCWAATRGITDSYTGGREGENSSAYAGECGEGNEARVCLGATLRVAHFSDGGGRGLAAVRAIEPGEVVLHVPRHAMLSCADVRACPAMAPLLPAFAHLSSHQLLVCYVLLQASQGARSPWHAYLRCLPRCYSLLSRFTPHHMAMLQVAEAVAEAQAAVAAVRGEWREARALLRAMAVPGKWLSWPAWSWGHCTVSSRTLYVPWDEAGALCPVADLLNYEPLSPTAPAAAAASPPAPPALPPSPSPLPAQPCCSHMPGDVDGSTAHTDASTAHTDASTAHTDDSTVGEAVSAGACDPECMRDAAALSDCTSDMHRVALSGNHATTAPPTCARITATHHAAMHATPHAAALASDAGTDSCDLVTQAYNGVTHACDRAADACDRVTDGGYSEEAQAYHIFARRRFEAGEQVVICYGCYSNLHLLLHYGFLLPSNPHDCIPMHPPCDPHQLGIPLPPPPPPCSSAAHTTPPPLCLQADGTPSFLLLALLRVWTTPYRLRRRVRHVALSGSAVSEEGEVAVQRWVGGECERLLAALPSTVQQDEALLSCLREGGGSKGEGAQRTMEGAGVGGKGCARGAGSGTEGVGIEDKEGGCDAHGEGVRTAAEEEEQQKAVLAVMWRVGYKRLLQRGMAVAQRALHAALQC
ncbi:unnamed protein product [Closterium sp. NIES-65]|nr:unnamed protein product [Closterium sp. NIES-65]